MYTNKNLITKLNTPEEKTKLDRINDFNEWMKKIKNTHYSDNLKMSNAYERIR